MAETVAPEQARALADGEALIQQVPPPFVDPDTHIRELSERREQAARAAEFHRRKLDETSALIGSCDAAIAAVKETLPPDRPTGLR